MADRHRAIGLLEAELAYTPLNLRKAHLQRLAAFLPEIQDNRQYAYEYLIQRITGFHADVKELVAIQGGDLRRGLAILLRTLSAQSPVGAPDPQDPAIPLDEISSRCRVTPNTVRRWAAEGLPLAYYLSERGATLCVQASLLARFLELRRAAERKETRKLTEAERRDALDRARVMIAGGKTQAEAVRLLAAESGVSLSSARRMLRECLQAAQDGSKAEREQFMQLKRDGVSVSEIARRAGRSEGSVRRAIHQAQYEEVASQKISFIASPDFEGPDAETTCLGEEGLATSLPAVSPAASAPEGLPAYLAELRSIPLLTRERETELFRKYNYLKWRMAAAQKAIRETGYNARIMDQFARLRRAAEEARTALVRCNLRLVVSVAKRHAGPLMNLMELVSEGNVCLMRAVECYDYRRQARFATYATWALAKHYARMVPEENYRLAAFVTGQEERLKATGDESRLQRERSEALEHARAAISRAVLRLTARERAVIESRYGANGRPARTLEEVGRALGVTRERIRQIEACALEKLRGMISPDVAEGLA